MNSLSREVSPWPGHIERVLVPILTVYAFCLPFRGVGEFKIKDVLGLNLDVVLMGLAAPFVVGLLVFRFRYLVRQRLFLACLAVAFAGLFSGLLNTFHFSGPMQLAREIYFPLTVAAFLLVSPSGFDRVLRGGLLGAGLTVVLSLIGYAVMVLFMETQIGVNPFIFKSPHPIFSYFYRLTGFYAHSPQHFGEYLVSILAIALCLWRSGAWSVYRHYLAALASLTTLALFLTFSYAWIGGLTLAYGFFHISNRRFPALNPLFVFAVVFASLIGTWAMNIGLPTTDGSDPDQTMPCTKLNVGYYYIHIIDADNDVCREQFIQKPYHARYTHYLLSKQVTLDGIRLYPLLGFGSGNYKRFVNNQPTYLNAVTYYGSPHCTYLKLPGESGIAGWLALIFFLWCLWSIRPSGPEHPSWFPWLGLVGMMLIGINLDVMVFRHFWLVIAFTARAQNSPSWLIVV